jgi:hypothetical protein
MMLISQSMDEFERIVNANGGQLAELWGHVKRVLRVNEVGEMLKGVTNDECMDVIFSKLPPQHYQFQFREKHGRRVLHISLMGIIIWEWELTDIGPSKAGELKPRRGSVLVPSYKICQNGFIWIFVKGPKVCVYEMPYLDVCETYAGLYAGESVYVVPVTHIHSCAYINIHIYIHTSQIVPVPQSVNLAGSATVYFNGLMVPLPGQGFTMRKYPVCNMETLSQTRT